VSTTLADAPSCEPLRFAKDRLRIMVWKDQTTRGRRKIPPELKLAILGCSRIRLAAGRMQWLVDVPGRDVRQRGPTAWMRELVRKFAVFWIVARDSRRALYNKPEHVGVMTVILVWLERLAIEHGAEVQ
jgi:hypothetical protein